MTLDDYIPKNPSQVEIKEEVGDYIANLKEYRMTGVGLSFIGPSGVGKTMLASIVMNAAREAGFKVESIRLDAYMTLHSRQMDLAPLLRFGNEIPERVVEWQEVYDHIMDLRGKTEFVLFDDVGGTYRADKPASGPVSPWFDDKFNELLRYRYDYARPTLITSNTPIEDWADRYSPSMASFLQEATSIIRIQGDDERLWYGEGSTGDRTGEAVSVDLGGSSGPPTIRKWSAAKGEAVPEDGAVDPGGEPVEGA
jgi:hypothetical protein